jgi:hypothetical protein
MSDERRFTEEEVAEILERAAAPEASSSRAAAGDPHGMTLAELQDIAAEVGIEPARIAAAAGALASRGSAPAQRRLLGAPLTVSRTVTIPRALDDDEWRRLVVELRETFGALGRIREHGTLRSWINGNLQVHVEPDGDHYRVRMRTMKGDFGPRMVMGSAFVVISIMMLVASVLGDGNTTSLVMGSFFGLGGLAQLGSTRALLKRWAGRRAAQMEALAERIPLLLKRGGGDT